MFGWTIVPHPSAMARGFTLIELLVACSVLATLAFTAWGGYANVQESAQDEIAAADLRRVADAVRRFRADTGYYPGQGPFFLSATARSEAECTATDGILRDWAAPDVDSARDAWFASPANLALLFDAPSLCSKHPLAFLKSWNAQAGRGWRGPYLDRTLRLWVDHGEDLNSRTVATTGSDGATVTSGPDGYGTPLAGTKIVDIPAYGSGVRHPAAGPSGNACTNQAGSDAANTCMLGWRVAPREQAGYDPEAHELRQHARPFLLFGLADNDHPRVVDAGPDGLYGGRNSSDACRANLGAAGGADDRVLCLEASS